MRGVVVIVGTRNASVTCTCAYMRICVYTRVCNKCSQYSRRNRYNKYNRHVTRVIRLIRVIREARVGSKSLICLYLRFRRVTRAFLG